MNYCELLIFQWLRHPRSSPLAWLGFRTAKGILSQAAYPTLTDMGMRQNPGTRVWPIYFFKWFHFWFQQCLNRKCLNQSGVVGDPKSSVFVKMSKQMLNSTCLNEFQEFVDPTAWDHANLQNQALRNLLLVSPPWCFFLITQITHLGHVQPAPQHTCFNVWTLGSWL